MTHPTLPEGHATRVLVRDHLLGEHATMPLLDRAAASLALLAGSMLLVDIVVIAVLDASWGAVDNLLWSGFVVLTPLALVLTSSALTRGVRRRWLAAPALLVLSVAMMAGLGLLADTAVQAWYDGDNLGLVWEAPNWAFAGALLALGVAVLRRSQATSRATERSSQEPALTSPES